MRIIPFLMLMFFAFNEIKAQSSDIANVEYTYFPQSSSDNSFRRFTALFNFPIAFGKEGSYLVPGIEYENINFKYKDDAPFPKLGEMDRFQSITLSLGYTWEVKNDWRVAAWAGMMAASNFELGKIVNDDLLFTGAFGFIKDRNEEEVAKPWRLILGVYYSTTSGRPFPLPIVNYYREFAPDWSFSLGVPKSNIKYYLSEKSELQAFVTLDGFYANIQENRLLDNSDRMAENISMTIVLGGLGYEYNFTDHLVYYLYAGHTIMNDIRLRDGEKEDVYTINDVNTFYGRTGLKIKI
ncbi:MAG TPA: DUF6268 family outer membrane beta-barrel protein [Salinimicrobium sp.]|nr:DUF6268 family outer membrane beta-barrel protein [Salinimicrobium sp.]